MGVFSAAGESALEELSVAVAGADSVLVVSGLVAVSVLVASGLVAVSMLELSGLVAVSMLEVSGLVAVSVVLVLLSVVVVFTAAGSSRTGAWAPSPAGWVTAGDSVGLGAG